MLLSRAGILKNFKFCMVECRNLHLLKTDAFINGKWVQGEKCEVFPVKNPYDDCVIAEIPDMDVVDAVKAIEAADEAFKTWKYTTPKERSSILRNWYNLCVEHSDHIAKIMTTENGKPFSESLAEMAYGNAFLEWNADCARHINGEILTSPWKNKQILASRQPLGVVSVITPWNFPHAMITRKVGALMAAGCTCVVKPSEETPLTALAAIELANQAGVPKGVVNVITSSRNKSIAVGEVLCKHDRVRAISFTGSTAVGKILYRHASEGIKKCFLELGGNAPFIVFPSADVQRAVDHAMLAKFRNGGQACVGANRFYIHDDVFDEFISRFKSKIKEHSVLGPGNKKGVKCGPMITSEQLKKVAGLVDDAVCDGAKVLFGGKVRKDIGDKFYDNTLIVNVTPDMAIYNEEIFGPVAVCHKFKSEDDVIKSANDTIYGLAAYVFTRDLGQAFRMSEKLEYGMVAINDGILSTPEAPFGGVKQSGIGREGSMMCVLEFTEVKYTLMSGLDK